MEEQEEKLSPELREKLLEVELAAETEARKLPRFDKQKALLIGLFSLGLGFTLGIALRAGVVKALVFGIFTGLVGFATGGFQRPLKKK